MAYTAKFEVMFAPIGNWNNDRWKWNMIVQKQCRPLKKVDCCLAAEWLLDRGRCCSLTDNEILHCKFLSTAWKDRILLFIFFLLWNHFEILIVNENSKDIFFVCLRFLLFNKLICLFVCLGNLPFHTTGLVCRIGRNERYKCGTNPEQYNGKRQPCYQPSRHFTQRIMPLAFATWATGRWEVENSVGSTSIGKCCCGFCTTENGIRGHRRSWGWWRKRSWRGPSFRYGRKRN